MKHKTHIVKVYIYNPDNLKEVIDIKEFTIKYIPTKKWNEYLILVNDLYCNKNISITGIIHSKNGIHQSPRKQVGESISNFIYGNTSKYQNRVRVAYPDIQAIKLTTLIFETKLLNMGDFKSKEELTELNLIFDLHYAENYIT